MDVEKATRFCNQWLPAWTGNRPELLLTFYTEDACYQDPVYPKGLHGHEQILFYFNKILATNPKWVWEKEEIFPIETGFVLKWKATIPVGRDAIIEYGLDIVEMDGSRITRNEIYFDRINLLRAMKKAAM